MTAHPVVTSSELYDLTQWCCLLALAHGGAILGHWQPLDGDGGVEISFVGSVRMYLPGDASHSRVDLTRVQHSNCRSS